MANPLTKKLGPLPVGVWGLIGAGGFVLYRHFNSGSSGAITEPTAQPDLGSGTSGDTGLSGGGGGTSLVSPDGGALGDVGTSAVGALGDIGSSQANALGDIGSTLAASLGDVAVTLAAKPTRDKIKRQKERGRGSVTTSVSTRHKLSGRGNAVVTKTVTRRAPLVTSTRKNHPDVNRRRLPVDISHGFRQV